MKYTLHIIIGILLIYSCSMVGQSQSYKRGVSYEIPFEEDVVALSKGTSWFYNWGVSPLTTIDQSLGDNEVVFVPMVWNGNYDENSLRAYLGKHSQVKYILGFNEPNFDAQADMTPSEAVAAWPRLQKIADDFNLKIVAPAVNFSPDQPYADPNKWLDEFFELLPPDARVDHIAVHCYMSWSSALMWYIGKFKKYGKPIWLTEFCAWDNFWEVPGDQPTNQMRFMSDAINYLESDPDIYRYAWFMPRTKESNKYPYMQLLEDNRPGVLTALGKVFANMSSQDKLFYFSVDEKIPAEHYSSMNIKDVDNSDNWKSSVMLRPTTDKEGVLEIYDFGNDKWVEYNVDVPEDGIYAVDVRYAAKVNTDCKILKDGAELGTAILNPTGSDALWNNSVLNIPLKKGKQTLRFQASGESFCLNWLVLSLVGSLNIENQSMNRKITFYPIPVRNTLYINSPNPIKSLSVFDLTGKSKIDLVADNNTCDLSFLAEGMYLLSVEDKRGIRTIEKIVKE